MAVYDKKSRMTGWLRVGGYIVEEKKYAAHLHLCTKATLQAVEGRYG